MRGNYEPRPRSFSGVVLLVVVGIIALPAAVSAMLSLVPVLVIFGTLSLIGGLLIGRHNYF